MVAMPRPDLSTTEAIAARVSCLLCRGLFSCGLTVFVHDNYAWVQWPCSGGAYDVPAAAAGFAAVVAMPRPDLSTTEAIAAFMSCLLCRGLFSCGPAVFVHDNYARVQRRCPAGCMLVHNCYWIRRCGDDAKSRIKHDRGYCRVHELFALPRLVFVWPCGVCTR